METLKQKEDVKDSAQKTSCFNHSLPDDTMQTCGRHTIKILHDHYLLDKTSLFTSSETHKLRGHQLKLAKDYSRTEVRQAFFSNRVVNEWNRLDEAVVMAPTLKCFKSRLELGNKN